MTVYPLERNSVFEPEIIQVMAGVYEEVLGELRLADRDDALAEVIAKESIEAARRGVDDVVEMRLWFSPHSTSRISITLRVSLKSSGSVSRTGTALIGEGVPDLCHLGHLCRHVRRGLVNERKRIDYARQHARAEACGGISFSGEDNALEHTLVVAYLFWSAEVSATIGRDDVANRVSGNRHPLAVHFS